MPTVPLLERGCECLLGLLRAPRAAQRAWLGLAIVGRNALGREHSTPGPGGMCRITGGSGKRLPQQERHGEALGSQEEASGRGEPHPANVQEQLQACWGRCQAGGRARAGDGVREGAAGSLCDPGQRASLPGQLLPPDAQTLLDGGPFRLRGLWVPTSTACISLSSKLGAEKPVLGTRSLHAIFLEEDAVVSVDPSTLTWTEARELFLGPAWHPLTTRLTNQDRGWVERVPPGTWTQAQRPQQEAGDGPRAAPPPCESEDFFLHCTPGSLAKLPTTAQMWPAPVLNKLPG